MKRFQECNWLVKLWRYRWYIPIPFKWLWFMYIKPFIVLESKQDEENDSIVDTGEEYNPRGKNLWRLLIGIAQIPMEWYYTHEEVMKRFKENENGRNG